MDNRSREQKAVDKLVDSIADIRFQDGNFAYMMMNQPPKVQRRFMRIFLHAIRYWAVDWKHENYHLKDEQTVQTAGMINTIINSKPEMLIEVHNGITINDVLSILPIKYDFELVKSDQYFLKSTI